MLYITRNTTFTSFSGKKTINELNSFSESKEREPKWGRAGVYGKQWLHCILAIHVEMRSRYLKMSVPGGDRIWKVSIQ